MIAEVDCTAKTGKSLCEFFNVQSFPTLMYGDPNNLEEYDGGRAFEILSEFAKENLVPICSVRNLDLCNDEEKAEIERYLAMTPEDLGDLMAAEEQNLKIAKETYNEEVAALQVQFEEAAQRRDAAIAAAREGGIMLMQAVQKAKLAAREEDEDPHDEL